MAGYLAGDFTNQAQAWENPPFFAQIQVCYRPLPWQVFQGIGFYVEQAYMNHLEEPYRQAVVHCQGVGDQILLKNYRLRDPQRWLGCGRERAAELLAMTEADVAFLPGCDVILRAEGEAFYGESEPGCQCFVQRKGQLTYLHTTVRLSAEGFSSHDQGRDPQTHAQVWGALAGPFQFVKVQDWSHLLPRG